MATDPYPAIRREVHDVANRAVDMEHNYCKETVASWNAAVAALNAKVEALLRETGASEYFAHQLLNEEPAE